MAQIDPILSLSLSVQANEGVFAILLGSGISRAASIPTGWEVVLDLVRKLATARHETCGPDPAAWYKTTFSEEPDYSKLLDNITTTSEERRQLLESYFEPNAEEREQGLKMPTAAHRAIARLVAGGYIRVIITTNFDRLTERAIEDEGIVPVVVNTPEGTEGALPLVHQKCLVLKLHGDYLDTRLKNTPAELAMYDERVDRLLDRILDEFGLIVCGWSGVWDTALRGAIERCKTRRFSMFWAAVGKPAEEASRLIALRAGRVIQVKDADSFFVDVAEKVQSLEESIAPHPLSAQTAAATLKRYVAEDRYAIRLHDLVFGEEERLFAELNAFNANLLSGTQPDTKEVIRHYDQACEILAVLLTEGCFWGRQEHIDFWTRCVQSFARDPYRGKSGTILNDGYRLYPTLQMLYAAGLGALAGGKIETLASLFLRTNYRRHDKLEPLLTALSWSDLLQVGKILRPQQLTPLSNHLFEVLRPPFRGIVPDDGEYEQLFDRYEYLQALVHADLYEKKNGRFWPLQGRFWWNGRTYGTATWVPGMIESEIGREAGSWAPLSAGLFNGSLARLQEVHNAVFGQVSKNEMW